MSNDGNRLAFVAGGSVFLHDRITRQTTQLLPRTDVVEAIVAGRGNVVVAATSEGAIFRIDLDPVRVSEIHSALRAEVPTVVARGSWALIRGGPFFRTEILGLVQVERPGLLRAPTELMGVRVSIGFRPAPIVALGPDWMLVFVPNATPLGPVPVLVSTPSVPGGVAATTTVAVTAPAFLRTNYPRLPESDSYAIAHQGFFSSVVTETSPATSDEIVHLYATGLGPVDQNVPDATWDFLLPLPRVTTPLNCTLDGLSVEGSAYLAPWNAGLYQVDVRLPRITSAHSARLVCMGASTTIPVAP